MWATYEACASASWYSTTLFKASAFYNVSIMSF